MTPPRRGPNRSRDSHPDRAGIPFVGAAIIVVAVVIAVVARGSTGRLPWNRSGQGTATVVLSTAPVPTASPPPPTDVPSTPTPGPSPTPEPDPRRALDALLADDPAIYGVILLDDDGTIIYSRNADTPFIAASLYKLVLLAEIYRLDDAGDLDLTSEIELDPSFFGDTENVADGYFGADAIGTRITVADALFATGAYSSNVAARALLSLTTPEALAAMAQTLGLDHTNVLVELSDLPDWPPVAGADTPPGDLDDAVDLVEEQAADGPVNLTTPRDAATFFAKLLSGDVVDTEASSAILGILSRQTINDRLPFRLPDGAVLAHKTGNLVGIVHDVGIIATPDGPRVLAVLVQDAADEDRAVEVIREIASIAYGSDFGDTGD